MPGVHGAHHNPNPPPMPIEYINPNGTNPPASSLIDITAPKTQVFDPVEKPQHYNEGKVECIDGIESACTGLNGFEGLCTGNAIKYLWRWKHKAKPIQDLEKSVWYINRLIKYLKENEAANQ